MNRDLFIATGNVHKFREFLQLECLFPTGFRLRSAQDAGGMPDVEENAGSFVGNARIKARALRSIAPSLAWVLADDSGLCVDALDGAPGIQSARYAGPEGDSAKNLAKLLADLSREPDGLRRAHFICVLVALDPNGREFVTEGRCHGHLLHAPVGTAGFGYDPIFVPDGHMQTFAQMGEAVKNPISHRGLAWKHLAEKLRVTSR
jgi:XTP/dITP diphosphohydrolase